MTDENTQNDQSSLYVDKDGIPYKSKEAWNANKEAEEKRKAEIIKIEEKDERQSRHKGTQTVKISDIDIPFTSMIIFMVKWAIASIPALLILMVLFAIFGGFFLGIISMFN